MSRSHKNMVSHFNGVFNIFERDDSVADFVFACDGLSGGEDMLQNLHNTLAELGGEAVKDEVGKRFRDASTYTAGNVVPQNHIV